MTKVSIIIPVYNVEDYLPKCLDSLINQTLEDIEIICINDGSTDNSLEILKAYEHKDRRIKIIDQENKGAGIARNNGLKIAQGEYIGFVDPDDWVNTEMYEKMYNQAKELNSEIVICKYSRFIEKSGKCRIPSIFTRAVSSTIREEMEIPSQQNLNKDVLNQSILVAPCYSWHKIYKRDLLENNMIKYSNDKCYEDVLFILKSHILAKNISYIDTPYYVYRIHNKSILRSFSKRYLYLLKVFDDTKNYLNENNLYDKFKNNLSYFIIMNTIWLYNQLDKPKYQKDLIRKVKVHLKPQEYQALKKELNLSFPHKILNVEDVGSEYKQHKIINFLGIKLKIRNINDQLKKEQQIIKTFKKESKKYPKDCYILYDDIDDGSVECIDAYSLFLYMQQKGIKSYYIILKENQLYKKLEKENKLENIIGLEKSNSRYSGDFLETIYDILLRTKGIISSFGKNSTLVNEFFKQNKDWKYIFLQHGQIFLKESIFMKNYLYPDKHDKILISSDQEYKIFKKYDFKDSSFIKCGLPRWDLLHKNSAKEKSILIMFTFRAVSNVLFEESLFKKNLDKLSNNPQLLDFLEQHNTKLYFAKHHSFKWSHKIDFEIKNDRIEQINTENISEYIRKCSMLITDWSSVAFDFMFQNKPVIYYILDKGDPILGKYDKKDIAGFDYKQYIMPNVIFDEQGVIDKIKYYVENNFELEDNVKEKYESFFYTKTNIREKLTNEIEKICNS